MGIQAHRPHTLLGECRIGTRCHLAESLENPVVLLQEEAEDSFKFKYLKYIQSRFPATLAHFLCLFYIEEVARSGSVIQSNSY